MRAGKFNSLDYNQLGTFYLYPKGLRTGRELHEMPQGAVPDRGARNVRPIIT